MANAESRQSRFTCTLPFSLHLTVMLLGVIGFLLSILVTIAAFTSDDRYRANADAVKYSAIWLLLTTILVSLSGLQGLLVRPHSCCFNCHIVLAVVSLVNLGVIGVSSLFVGNVFWIIYIVLVFVFELWVTILLTCCKVRSEVGVAATELPVANVAAQQHAVQMPVHDQVVGIPAPSQFYPPTYKVDPRQEVTGVPHPRQGDDRFEDVR